MLSLRMIMLQFADENPIGWKENIEFCERYDSSLIHYENRQKFEVLSVKAQSLVRILSNTTQLAKDNQDYQLMNPNIKSQSDFIFVGKDQGILKGNMKKC